MALKWSLFEILLSVRSLETFPNMQKIFAATKCIYSNQTTNVTMGYYKCICQFQPNPQTKSIFSVVTR